MIRCMFDLRWKERLSCVEVIDISSFIYVALHLIEMLWSCVKKG